MLFYEITSYAEATTNEHRLPDSISQHSVILNYGDRQASTTSSAGSRRNVQHAAGRFCAEQALRKLRVGGCHLIGRGPIGQPLWPPGVVGSITHSDSFVSAAVSFEENFRGIGIDSEPLLDPAVCVEVAPSVARSGEIDRVREATGFDELHAVTLLFSAKEAVFKCIAPLLGSYFDFTDVELMVEDAGSGSLTARIARSLSPAFPRGARICTGFSLGAGHIHTHALLWPRSA